jgi:hypothetical protein
MAFWLYIDSKDRKAVWYLLRGVELARQGKARQRRKEDKCETSKVAYLHSPPETT